MSDAHEHPYRSLDDTWRGEIDGHIRDLRSALLTNTEITRETAAKLGRHIESTEELRKKVNPVVEAMETMQSGIRVIGWLGGSFKWVASIVGACAAAWVAWKAGK